jgi:hypothetical protein
VRAFSHLLQAQLSSGMGQMLWTAACVLPMSPSDWSTAVVLTPGMLVCCAVPCWAMLCYGVQVSDADAVLKAGVAAGVNLPGVFIPITNPTCAVPCCAVVCRCLTQMLC